MQPPHDAAPWRSTARSTASWSTGRDDCPGNAESEATTEGPRRSWVSSPSPIRSRPFVEGDGWSSPSHHMVDPRRRRNPYGALDPSVLHPRRLLAHARYARGRGSRLHPQPHVRDRLGQRPCRRIRSPGGVRSGVRQRAPGWTGRARVRTRWQLVRREFDGQQDRRARPDRGVRRRNRSCESAAADRDHLRPVRESDDLRCRADATRRVRLGGRLRPDDRLRLLRIPRSSPIRS
jgi:hypothetical protein